VVTDLMIHDLDVILSMVPSALRSVEAVGVPVLTSSVDIANARLRFANGCIANVTASRVSLKRERKLRIFQADAYLAVDYGERRIRICRREPDADGQAALVLEEREVPEGDALELEVAAFLRAVREREAPTVSGWDGLRALEVVEVIRESLATEVRAAQGAPLV
jgi:predicted dehydrogenase